MDFDRACALINEGLVPTAALAGESFPLDRFEEAFALMERKVPGRDAVRFSLDLT
jgi:threonine dehydrogenase-like Zn-dependent dehydrogenase